MSRNFKLSVKKVNGLLWPDHDVACAAVVFDSLPDLDRAVKRCVQRRTVIQAGGNCGVWARHLAPQFNSVWTWEPDPHNYFCLARNTMGFKNVFCVNEALGPFADTVKMSAPEANNCGAYQVEQGGEIRMSALDTFNPKELGVVDLIYLDLEGFELPALHGAQRLINRDQPIIAVEDKGLSEKYGVAQGDVIKYLKEVHDYEVIDQYARDFVLRRRDPRSSGQGNTEEASR